ncbi:hypothetical protein B296_00052823 [Ensete ventricosum]|uniref:Uncharacterized protein n=1 Tax=Ensete ventricosum TaxID=4639 RepID=A0A426YAL2_ENSVE|nr:hypothetical protein B296_00052823 [Ensete ventricosum]
MPVCLSASPTAAAATTAASGAAHRFIYPQRPCLHRAAKVSFPLLLRAWRMWKRRRLHLLLYWLGISKHCYHCRISETYLFLEMDSKA